MERKAEPLENPRTITSIGEGSQKGRKGEDPNIYTREIIKKLRYRSKIQTLKDQEKAKGLLKIVKNSLCAFPSFLGAHIIKKPEKKMKIIA